MKVYQSDLRQFCLGQ